VNSKWVVGVCEDKSLIVRLVRSGRSVFVLQLEAPVSSLLLNGDVCLVITTAEEMITWNLQDRVCVIRKSLHSLLLKSESKITNVSVSEHGIPLVILGNFDAYIFNKSLDVWTALNSDGASLRKLCQPLKFIASVVPNGIIAALCTSGTASASEGSLAKTSSIESVEEGQLELLIEATAAFPSPIEFRFLVNIYTRKLLERGKTRKLEEFIMRYCVDSTDRSIRIDVELLLRQYGHSNLENFMETNRSASLFLD